MHADFKSPSDSDPSEPHWLFVISTSLPTKIERLTADGSFPRTKGEEVLGVFEHNRPPFFSL